MSTRLTTMAKGAFSTSTQDARRRSAAIKVIRGAQETSSAALVAPEVVESSGSSSPLAEIYGSAPFRLAWDNEIAFHVAQNVVHLRRFRRQPQAAVAKTMGTSQSAVARIESGDDNITLSTLRRLADALEGRIRLSIEPREVEMPSWPPWWEFVGTPVVTHLSEWRFCKAHTEQHGTDRLLIAGWYGKTADTLTAEGRPLVLAEAGAR